MPAPGVENKTNPYTLGEISERFKDYIEKQRPGLKRFYTWGPEGEFDEHLNDSATRGLAMTRQLIQEGCPREVAMSLSALALYDLVILLDNSMSMRISEGGARVETIHNTLKAASTVYSFAENNGITAVRFLNSSKKYSKVTPGKVSALMERIVFEGVTSIGTGLRDKVLGNHVTSDMKRPLLVIIITDAEIEGEVPGLLRDIIVSQAVALKEKHGEHGPQGLLPLDVFPQKLRRPWHHALIAEAIAYQFAIIGSDEGAQDLVKSLDDDSILGDYIDCLGNENELEDIREDIWNIVPKLLLGAISGYWDTKPATSKDTLQNKDSKLPPRPSSDDDESELEEDDSTIFGAEKNKPKRGGKGKGNADAPNDRSSSSNPPFPSYQPEVGSSPNRQTSAPIPPKNQANESPPIGDDRPTQGRSVYEAPQPGIDSGANISLPSNQAEAGSPPSGQTNITTPPEIPANESPPEDSQANAGPITDAQANASPPTDSQANEGLPTDVQVNAGRSRTILQQVKGYIQPGNSSGSA